MSETYHKEHLLDRATMLAMRAMIALQPKASFEPNARPEFDELMQKTPSADGVTYQAASVGSVAGWWCYPENKVEGRAIAYFHGGAYVLGSAQAYRNFVGQIAARSRSAIFVAEYRLAPEHVFPCAIEDAEAVYHGLVDAGFDQLAVAGDSAGGGLALALLLRVVVAGQEMLRQPVAGAVISPWTALALTGESMDTRAKDDPLLSRDVLDQAARTYLSGASASDAGASPLYGDCTHLPPVLFHVGEDEVLLDDSRRFAARIATAGGTAELHVWQGMTYVFASNLMLQAAKDALDIIGAYLEQQFQSAP